METTKDVRTTDLPGADWRRLASAVARKRNLGLWLDGFAPLMVGASLTAAVLFLLLRHLGRGTEWASLGMLAAMAGLGAWAWWRAKGRFCTERDGLVHLESWMGLHNRLSCAADGVGRWPGAENLPSDGADGMRWRGERAFGPPVASFLLVLAALLIPVTPRATSLPPPVQEPLAWSQTESLIEQMSQDDLIEKAALDRLREQLEALRQQPKENWYGHGSLEAGDALKDKAQEGLQKLHDNLNTARQALENAASQLDAGAAPEGLQKEGEALGQAVEGMKSGSMPASPQAMGGMGKMDGKTAAAGLTKMTPEQMRQMAENLKAAQGKAGNALGLPQEGSGKLPDLKPMPGKGPGGKGPGKPGDGTGTGEDGQGGVSRGPGHPPLAFGAETDLKTSGKEGLEGNDLSKAVPGEITGESQGTHDLDKSQNAGGQNAGAVTGLGQGGEAVWTEDLSPEDREAVKKYFGE